MMDDGCLHAELFAESLVKGEASAKAGFLIRLPSGKL
jgi:hypothetical protein